MESSIDRQRPRHQRARSWPVSQIPPLRTQERQATPSAGNFAHTISNTGIQTFFRISISTSRLPIFFLLSLGSGNLNGRKIGDFQRK